MENGYTEEQIRKAEEKQKVIQRLLQGEKLKEVLKGFSELSKYAETWSRLKKKYQENGIIGLIDTRGRSGGYKVKNETITYIQREKEDNPGITGEEIVGRIKNRTGETVSKRWIQKILQKLKLGNPRGRPEKENHYDKAKGQPVDHAGCWFLKGADYNMVGTATITKIIEEKRKEYIEKHGQEKSLRTLVSWPETLQQKNEALMYLPVFGMSRPKELERYHKSGLGIISGIGKRYRYSTIDKHQRELEKLKISEALSGALSKCYLEALFIKLELEDKSCFYIDGHYKTVWSSKNIPRGFRTTLNKTEKSLEQMILTGGKGHPLILLTCPGDRHLTKEMFNLIDAFEGACGKNLVKVTVFDREGVALKMFQEFDRRHKCFITLLKENQHKGEKSFEIKKGYESYKTDEKTGEIKSWIADADITLEYKEEKEDKDKEEKENKEGKKNKKEKIKYQVRVGLLKKTIDGREKLIPIITNIKREEEPDIKKIADKYFDRWPNQENIIKDMVYGIEIDRNHGYKKVEVENRTLLRKKEEIEQNLRGLEKRIKPAGEEIKKLQGEIGVIEKAYQDRFKDLNKEKKDLHYHLLLNKKGGTKREHIQRLNQIENKMLALTRDNEKHLFNLRNKLENKMSYEKGLQSQDANKEEELKSLDMEQKLYEIVTEKDNTMSNFKMLLYNLSRYAREQWFSPDYEKASFMMMRDKFYNQDGYVKIGRRNIKVTLNPYDDDKLQKAVEQACIKFNNADIQSAKGKHLEIYVEPLQKTGGNPDVAKNLSF